MPAMALCGPLQEHAVDETVMVSFVSRTWRYWHSSSHFCVHCIAILFIRPIRFVIYDTVILNDTHSPVVY